MLISICKVGEQTIQPVLYAHHVVTLKDQYGKSHGIKYIEVPHIASVEERPDFEKVQKLFPCIPLGLLDRPNVPVGMLLGQNANALLPIGGVGEYQVEGLRVRHTVLGEYGYVLDGYHPYIWTSAVTNCSNFDMKAVQEGLNQIHDPLIQICHLSWPTNTLVLRKVTSFLHHMSVKLII